jgi:hypothetical protein
MIIIPHSFGIFFNNYKEKKQGLQEKNGEFLIPKNRNSYPVFSL